MVAPPPLWAVCATASTLSEKNFFLNIQPEGCAPVSGAMIDLPVFLQILGLDVVVSPSMGEWQADRRWILPDQLDIKHRSSHQAKQKGS